MMAQPQRRAEFFARPDGVCIVKAPPLKERERYEFFEASDKTCKQCFRPIACLGIRIDRPHVEGQIDHILARSRGGQNDRTNLRVLCVTCNASKGSK